MSILTMLLIVWGGLTTVLVVLLIYRSTLTMSQDEQLFLDDTASHLKSEQDELVRRVNRISPFVRLFGAASGTLILVIAGMWIWQGLNNVQ